MKNIIVLSALVVAIGCGQKEELGIITGQVTFEGAPVRDAKVVFRDYSKGVHILAALDTDGRYQVYTAGGKGLPLGDYKVCVSPSMPSAGADIDSSEPYIPPDKPIRRSDIPDRYRDVRTSNITVTIQKGKNILDIPMSAE